MKVSELTGAKLNEWVARAEGKEVLILDGNCFLGIWHSDKGDVGLAQYSPSTDWAQGGPIIQRERISLAWIEDDGSYQAYQFRNGLVTNDSEGDDALEAAMRCYVASKFGEEVPDE